MFSEDSVFKKKTIHHNSHNVAISVGDYNIVNENFTEYY